MIGYGKLVAQSEHLVNQNPYFTHHLGVQNSAIQAEQISTNRTDPSVVELLNQQQELQRDATSVISKLADLEM